ncbi:MAG: arsenate reductase ArsC [Flavobacteriales bacterium]|nr:arsenate reductase ArsC [Flavobacteriales bacterium]
MKNILFLCVENSCRSQIAEAFGHIYSNENDNIYSAGSKAIGVINPGVYTSFDDIEYDFKSHYSKGIEELPEVKFNTIILMGCGEKCPIRNADKVIQWKIPDPKELSQEEFNVIRDQIKENVIQLLDEMGSLV